MFAWSWCKEFFKITQKFEREKKTWKPWEFENCAWIKMKKQCAWETWKSKNQRKQCVWKMKTLIFLKP